MACLLEKLLRRGLIGNIYPESQEYRQRLKDILVQGKTTIYAGFDPTSKSLHVGNLAVIMSLLHFHKSGHQVICLVGDATAKVGDPSGHVRDRRRIEEDIIEANTKSIEDTLRKLFRNHKRYFVPEGAKLHEPILVRNSTWYRDKNIIDFVSDYYRPVRVGGLLHKKTIQDRLNTNEGLNMAEFCYQIFQAFDWMELRQRHNCKLQVGGSDQGGNIYTGHDLIKKCLGKKDSIGLLTPLITNKSGKKLGKSSSGSHPGIWLHSEETSPFDFYQFFHKTPDSDVGKFLNLYTFYDEEFIEDLIKNHLKKREDIWYCQRKLAESVCLLVHGDEGLSTAKQMTDSLFPRKAM